MIAWIANFAQRYPIFSKVYVPIMVTISVVVQFFTWWVHSCR